MSEIKILTGKEVLATRVLWEEVFTEDSKRFVDYYYSHKAEKNICFVMQENNEIVSMVHLTPYDMCVKNESGMGQETKIASVHTFSSFYRVGVATKEAYRHKGYMTALLGYAFSYMKNCNIPFTFLMPANPGIYEPFGFRYIYERTDYVFCPDYLNADEVTPQLQIHEVLSEGCKRSLVDRDNRNNRNNSQKQVIEIVKAEEKHCEQLVAFSMEQLTARYDFFLKRDEEYFRTLLMELESENGCVYLVYVKGELVGYFTHACEEEEFVQEVLIKECYESVFVVDEGAEGFLIRMTKKTPIIMGKKLCFDTRVEKVLQQIADGKNKNGFMNEVV